MDLSSIDKAEGTVEHEVGSAVGADRLEAEGLLQQKRGAIQGAVSTVKDRVGGTVEVATGKVKQLAGEASGNRQLQLEGGGQQLVGRACRLVATRPAAAAAGLGLVLLIVVRLLRR